MTIWKIKLRTLLLSVFLSTIIASSSLIIFFTYVKYSKSIHELSLETISLARNRTYEKIECILQEIESLPPFGFFFYEKHPKIALTNTELVDFFLGTLKYDQNLFAYFIALSDGSYLIAINVKRSNISEILTNTPEGTAYIVLLWNPSMGDSQNRAYYNADLSLISLHETSTDFEVRSRPWYTLAEKEKMLVWTDPYLHYYLEGEPGFSTAEPFYDPSGRLICIVGADLAFNLFSQFLKGQSISKNGSAYIIDKNGKTLLPVEENRDPEVRAAFLTYLKTKNSNFSYQFNKRTYLASIDKFPTAFDKHWSIVFIAPLSDFFADILKSQHQAIILSVCILGLASLFVAILSFHVSRPIMQLSQEIDRISRLDLESKLRILSHIAELSRMDTSIASMRIALRSFAHYIPKELAKQLMRKEHEIALGGEKKTISIFFTDIANFTTIAESLPIEKLSTLLAEYFEILTKVILDYGGTIDKYIGDSIMSIWGAPEDLSDFAARACTAALLCQKKLSAFNEKCKKKGLPELKTRMGIKTGPAIIGNFGTQERMDYSAIGDSVNTAARLQALNKTYRTKIIIGEETCQMIGSQFLSRPLDIVELRGKKNRMKVFELVAKKNGEPEIRPTADQIELCDLFSKAFQTLDRGDKAAALDLFELLHKRFPEDHLTIHYLQKLSDH